MEPFGENRLCTPVRFQVADIVAFPLKTKRMYGLVLYKPLEKVTRRVGIIAFSKVRPDPFAKSGPEDVKGWNGEVGGQVLNLV